ncbi:MAG: mycofactocin biosynthesis glycosyltransferase MftF [Acidimicrobiales bacterium]
MLIGGAPLRILRLGEAGARLVDRLARGWPVPSDAAARGLARRLVDAGAHPRPPGHDGPTSDGGTSDGGDGGTSHGNGGHGHVAVVIPVRDRPAGLAVTLRAIQAAGTPSPAELIVVDDGSGPDEAAATAALCAAHGARLIRCTHPAGPAAARNEGWRAAMSALVAFVDSDCEPAPGWLARLLPHFGDPLVAAVAPRIRAVRAPGASRTLGSYERARSPLDRGPLQGPVRPGGRIPFVPSAAVVVRREVLAELDGFDEAMRVGEDVDLVWRLAARGRTVRYEPGSTVAHPTRSNWAAWAIQRCTYGSSAAPLARRHGAAVAPLRISRSSMGAWTLAGAGYPGAGLAVAALSGAMLVPKLSGLTHPRAEALRLAGGGHLRAGASIADGLRRVWWPFLAAMSLCSGRARRIALCTIVALVVEWVEVRPALDPLTWVVLRVADDVAYGSGVWASCLRARSARALLPAPTG